jgi:hypothetical protein
MLLAITGLGMDSLEEETVLSSRRIRLHRRERTSGRRNRLKSRHQQRHRRRIGRRMLLAITGLGMDSLEEETVLSSRRIRLHRRERTSGRRNRLKSRHQQINRPLKRN